ncbi:MAG: tetratricopeptide repeat protein [Terriglobales bacterium]
MSPSFSAAALAVAKQPQAPATAGSSSSSSSKPFQATGQRTLLLCLLLTVVVLVSYNPVIHNAFVNYDDPAYIADNPPVRAGVTWTTVKWAFTSFYEGNWDPLTWLSHALDCELFGLNPVGHHYMSVLLHAASSVLLFLLLQNATGFRWRSLIVAALFALHPINVESVAWAAERKNVLSMMFFLLALLAYGWYARKPDLRRYTAVVAAFVLALLSKPQVIALPFLLLLWDYWPLGRVGAASESGRGAEGSSISNPKFSTGRLVLEKVPLLLLSAASAGMAMKAQKLAGAVQPLSQSSLPLRLETAAISYVGYMGKAFWPSKLVALYPRPTRLYPGWEVAAALILLVIVTALVLRARQRPYLAVGWFWFLGSLVPMIGLVQTGAQAMADRYAYIPSIGLFVMMTWLAADWSKSHRLPMPCLAMPALSCLLVLGVLTYWQVGYWHDTQSFWERTLALTHDNYVAEDNLGEVLFAQGKKEEGAAHFRAALAIRADDLPATLNLGAYEHERGNLPAAIDRYQTVVQHALDVGVRAAAYGDLGSAYRQKGELAAAKQCYEAALQLVPNGTMAMIGLGLIAQKNGDPAEAVRQYSHAMAVQPTDVGFLLLAQALEQVGRVDEAKIICERVTRFSPNLSEAQKEAESLLAGK